MRIYHHYEKWEDFHNGLYKIGECTEEIKKQCYDLFINLDELEMYMKRVIDEWIYASEQQMTNPSRNKQAWLGQAACCMKCGANEDNVKEVWRLLSQEQMDQANKVADNIINYYKVGKELI